MCTCGGCTCMYTGNMAYVKVMKQYAEFLLPPFGSWGLNLGCQGWFWVSFPSEPSSRPFYSNNYVCTACTSITFKVCD